MTPVPAPGDDLPQAARLDRGLRRLLWTGGAAGLWLLGWVWAHTPRMPGPPTLTALAAWTLLAALALHLALLPGLVHAARAVVGSLAAGAVGARTPTLARDLRRWRRGLVGWGVAGFLCAALFCTLGIVAAGQVVGAAFRVVWEMLRFFVNLFLPILEPLAPPSPPRVTPGAVATGVVYGAVLALPGALAARSVWRLSRRAGARLLGAPEPVTPLAHRAATVLRTAEGLLWGVVACAVLGTGLSVAVLPGAAHRGPASHAQAWGLLLSVGLALTAGVLLLRLAGRARLFVLALADRLDTPPGPHPPDRQSPEPLSPEAPPRLPARAGPP